MELKGDTMPTPLNVEEIAARNPSVDAQKLEHLREVQQVLERAGVVRKADYRLSPALGGAPAKPILPPNGSIRMM
jgi:hypothetical protein